MIARDVAAVSKLDALATILDVLAHTSGMGFTALARVSDLTWTACAVRDDISFGLKPGEQLDLKTTLCFEAREACQTIVIKHASEDPLYRDHHTPKIYNIESYVSVPVLMKDGRYFGNLCAIDPRPNDSLDSKTLFMFERFAQLIGLQLSDELERENTLSVLKDERETSELREQFIAILGHDLRNPLQAIHASSILLERQLTDPKLSLIAKRIQGSVKRMSGLIEDTLDFARGRLGGGLVVQFKAANIIEAVSAVVRELQAAHPERQIITDLNIERAVSCDVDRIQQLASNLIGNALTHGAPHTPVKVFANIDGQDLVLVVWNQGDPIPTNSMDKIFAPFWRQSTAVHRQGLGLGLHICAQIVHAHGGHLSVVSTHTEGTAFTARLPLSPPGCVAS